MKKKLTAANIITLVLLISVILIEKYPQRIYNRINAHFAEKEIEQPYSYIGNPAYTEATDLYSVYSGQKDIVMLGTSLTYRICWNELLNREDVANRGIGSDITEGFLNRLNFVLKVKPRICFIEGGVNDLVQSISNENIIKNLNAILDTLVSNNIKPVLTTVTYVTKEYVYGAGFNKKIEELNIQITKLAGLRKIDLINLNPALTDGLFLRPENAFSDGIHFTSKAYSVWRTEIIKVLEKEKI